MARGSFFAGMMKSGALAAALLAGAAVPGYAGDPPKLALTGSAVMTTDYMFRGVSNTSQNPAVQPEFDLTYGMFFAYIWGSNTVYGEGIEIDYGGGIYAEMGPGHLHLRRLLLHLSWRDLESKHRLSRGEGRCVLDHRRLDPFRRRLVVAG